jgi:hypothetical protein
MLRAFGLGVRGLASPPIRRTVSDVPFERLGSARDHQRGGQNARFAGLTKRTIENPRQPHSSLFELDGNNWRLLDGNWF